MLQIDLKLALVFFFFCFSEKHFMLSEICLAGHSYLEFSKGLSFQSELSTASIPCKYLNVYVFIQVRHCVGKNADGGLTKF